MIVAQRAEEDEQDERDQHALLRRPDESAGSSRQGGDRGLALMRFAPLLRPDGAGDDQRP